MGVLKNPILIKLSRWLEAFLYNRATHILVNSPAYRDYMYTRGIPREKVSLIPNGVDPTMFTSNIDANLIRTKYGLGDKFIATYAGALGQANDIGNIIRAAALLVPHDEIHFLIVGDGKERSALEQKARELGLSNITFTGALPKTEMPQLLAASNVCIATLMDIPMFRTTYPNKVFDYMAAEKPTILGIDGVIREVVEAADGGMFVPPGNEDALARSVLHLFQNPSTAVEMGRNARSYVVKHFNRTTQVIDFGALLENLVGRA
jgi:glycosyltransferase involved in cell wall biosynthesis